MSAANWKAIPRLPGYEASDHGEIRSSPGERRSGRVLKARISNGRHLRVCCGRKSGYQLVHRLVLEAFVGPCPEGMECRHLDGNPTNNHVSNLRWGTSKENTADMMRHGRFNPPRGERSGSAKLSAINVADIRCGLAAGVSGAELARRFGVAANTVYSIKSGRNWPLADDAEARRLKIAAVQAAIKAAKKGIQP